MVAAFWGFNEVVKTLVDNGAGGQLLSTTSLCLVFFTREPSCLCLSVCLSVCLTVCLSVCLPVCLFMVAVYFQDVNAPTTGNLWTPLHAAAFQEHGKVLVSNQTIPQPCVVILSAMLNISRFVGS